MNREFEMWVRLRYGGRYDVTRDINGYYCREVVKRMFDVWCHCRGLNVVCCHISNSLFYLGLKVYIVKRKNNARENRRKYQVFMGLVFRAHNLSP